MNAESDLKEWLDTHGFPAPQPSTVSDISSAVFDFWPALTAEYSVTSSLPRSAAILAWPTSSHRSSLQVLQPVPKLRMQRSPTNSSILGVSLS
jgi:hypothetical protein